MNVLESMIYGLISGISDVLPISSQANSALLKVFFGSDGVGPLRNLFVHVGTIIALILSCRSYFDRITRQQKEVSSGRRRRRADSRNTYDLKLIITAAIPMLAGLLMYSAAGKIGENIGLLGLLLVMGGVIVYIPEHFPQGNKNASKLSSLDSVILGLCTALSVLPGISRVGCILSYSSLRGADKNHAINWAFALSIPALVLISIFDLISIVSIGVSGATFLSILGCVLAGICSFAAAWGGVLLMRFIAFRSSFSIFGYMNWGVALVSFILYLIV